METLEDQSGILEILEAEKEELEQTLQDNKLEVEDLRKQVVPEKSLENLDFDFFTILEEKGMLITGVALAEGIWKNVVYSAEEIKKAVNQLVGKPIKIEHGNDKEFGDKTVGEVVESKWDEDLKVCKFKAKVTEPKAVDYVKAGRFKAVSMSTWMDKIPIGQEGIKMGLDYKFAELSLVENPACDRCFIFHCEQLSKQMEKDLKGEKKETIIGEEKMEEENNSAPNLEISEEELSEEKPIVLAWVEDNEELELLELSSEEELEELRKTRKVVGYYYGYLQYYPYYGYPKKDYGYDYPYKYYPYKYKKYKYKYPKKEKGSEDEDLEELPFEEMEDNIVCKACGEKFTNFKDFIKHWAKDHMEKYGKYKPAEKYPEKQSDEDLKKGQLKIVFNKKTKKYTVFEVPEEGLWKIVKVFDTKDEAQKFISGGKEEKAAEKPTPITCPACGEKFEAIEDFNKHWTDTHEEKYGVYKPESKYPSVPEQKSESLEKEKEGLEKMEEKKEEPKAEVKKEEPKVEAPKVEAPKVEEPKVEPKIEEPKVEPKVEAPKEEPKQEEPKVEPKVEPIPVEVPIVIVPEIEELPKEEPKVEAPKIEEPKVEAPKEEPITEEELLEALKEHPEAKKVILEKWIESKRSKQ